MAKHTVMIILSVAIVGVALGGFPPILRTPLLVAGGTALAVLSYLSSVVYCSNCKKLIEDAEQALPQSSDESTTPPKIQ